MKANMNMVLNCLREDSRQSLTSIRYKTGVPLSSVFKITHRMRSEGLLKPVVMVDFAKIGFPFRLGVFLTARQRDEAKKFLLAHPRLNNLSRLSGRSDLYAELVFKDMVEMQDFLEEVESLEGVSMVSHHFLQPLSWETFHI